MKKYICRDTAIPSYRKMESEVTALFLYRSQLLISYICDMSIAVRSTELRFVLFLPGWRMCQVVVGCVLENCTHHSPSCVGCRRVRWRNAHLLPRPRVFSLFFSFFFNGSQSMNQYGWAQRTDSMYALFSYVLFITQVSLQASSLALAPHRPMPSSAIAGHACAFFRPYHCRRSNNTVVTIIRYKVADQF